MSYPPKTNPNRRYVIAESLVPGTRGYFRSAVVHANRSSSIDAALCCLSDAPAFEGGADLDRLVIRLRQFVPKAVPVERD